MYNHILAGEPVIIQVGARSSKNYTGISRHYVVLVGVKDPIGENLEASDFLMLDTADGRVEPLLNRGEKIPSKKEAGVDETGTERHPYDVVLAESGYTPENCYGRFLIKGKETGYSGQDYGFQIFYPKASSITYSV